MKITRTVIPAIPQQASRPEATHKAGTFALEESYQPSNGLEWAGLVGGRLALVSTPVAAGAGLVTAALTGDVALGVKVGLGISVGAGVSGGALGLLAYHAFKDLDIPS
jgi:hypothetical protein